MDRAFSPLSFSLTVPGALPQAGMDAGLWPSIHYACKVQDTLRFLPQHRKAINALASARGACLDAVLHRNPRRTSLYPMKLRTDLLEHLTMDDIAEVALSNNPRYKPEPLFSKTGTGSLSPTSTEDSAREVAHNTELIRKVEARQAQAGKPDAEPNGR